MSTAPTWRSSGWARWTAPTPSKTSRTTLPGVSQLSDPDGALWRHFGIAEQSSYVLLDATGKQVLKSGYGGQADLEQRVADVVR